MIKEELRLGLAGVAFFQWKDASGKIIRLWKRKNAIQPLAKDIAAKRLIGNAQSIIDTISLYSQGNLVASESITGTSVVQVDQVSFQATFSPGDFSGPFDEARLIASGMGAFSVITGLVGTKQGTESLLVTWNIQVS